jgi:tetratricopeptide (TPR) repeat protein
MSEQPGSRASGGEAAVGTNSPAAEPLASSSSFVGSGRRLSAIRDALGEGALRLAYHAAVPVVVDADLLNLLRVNFFLDDPPDILPFEIEAELLLSPLFREIGEGLYEIDPGLRNLLLSGLHTRYGDERVRRVASLLEQYTHAAAAWRSLPELELAQQLTALSFLDPAGAERWLDVHEASAAQPSSSSAPSVDDGPGREWYVAMRRRVAENSDIKTIDTEIRYAGEALLQLLSDGDISARLSVIRRLESLASLPDTDADEVVTVLCAFIQKWDERSPGPSKRVTLDVQAALSLIGSLPHIEFRLEGVALTGANLAGLDFSYAVFNRVMLTELDARVLDLTYAQFTDVILSDANLDGAFLDDAFLEFHTLRQVSLKGVSHEGAYIAANTIQSVTGSHADGTPLEIRSLSAEDETMRFSAEVGPKEELAGEAPEKLPESGSPDESSSAESGAILDAEAMLIEARTAEEVGQWERARDAYRGFLDVTGPGGLKNPDARQGLVRCYFQLGEPDKAVELLQSALMIYDNPGDPHRDFVVAAYVLAELGRAKLRMGLFEEAIAHLTNAVAAAHATGEPVHEARAEASLGTALIEFGHASEAEEHYRLALYHYMGQHDIGGEEAQVLLGLAGLLVQADRRVAAELAGTVLQLDPTAEDKRQARDALLGLLAVQADSHMAAELAGTVLQLDPTAEDKRQVRRALLSLLAPLSAELRQAIASPLAAVRAGAVQELALIQRGTGAGMALAAQLALEELAQDDSRSVAAAATAALAANASSVPPAPPRPELALSREYLRPQPLALSDQRAEEMRRTINLSAEDVEAGLASIDPNMRVPAYIQLQVRPDSRYFAQLINCFWLESYLASSQKETRPLWQLIVAVQSCYRNGLNDESLKRRLIFTMRISLTYLEADDTIDTGGECKKRLRQVLGRIESH